MARTEPYRPQFHFTAPEKWLNDPNGLIYFEGEYHLFYQYHPESSFWGPMHWGHAVSDDLVHWQHLPIALRPDGLGQIYSGSAVIDRANTAGFGPNAMVAIFTHHHTATAAQSQSLAVSTDRGRTWTMHGGNPVIPTDPNLPDFRDPKVFWYDTGDGDGRWVMSLAAGKTILFFTSPNLREWTASGSFGDGHGATDGVWETPDLFPLPIEGSDEPRWLLLVGVGDGAPAGGSGQQYFVGTFDGSTFVSDHPRSTVLWMDYGADFYATQSWSNSPDGRRLAIAWMSNWAYANLTPTTVWRGAMTLPRVLSLVPTPDGPRLLQRPVAELAVLRGPRRPVEGRTIPADGSLPVAGTGRLVELDVTFEIDAGGADRMGVRVCFGPDHHVSAAYTPASHTLTLDRTHGTADPFHGPFAIPHDAPLPPHEGAVRLRLFLDHSSVELFANGGRVTITDQIFPPDFPPTIELFADGAPVAVRALSIYDLVPARFTHAPSRRPSP